MAKSSKPISLSKRALFQGRFRAPVNAPIRPPYSQNESAFLETCSVCDKCISACDEGVLKRGAGGYPEIDFHSGECSFCGDCVTACAPGAISRQKQALDAPWSLDVSISSACLSANAITCRVCGDRCDARAIRFQLCVGGVADPIIDQSACTGCGACVAPCPVDAIEVVHSQIVPHPEGAVEVSHSQMEELS